LKLRSGEAKQPFHHCSIHHIDYWENGGPTDLDNLIPLCSRHHHKAHEGGWKLSLNPNNRQLTVNYP
jgi:predicted restriction endonuclease